MNNLKYANAEAADENVIEAAKKGFYYALYMSQFNGAAPGGMEKIDIDFVST